jgi:hypothetical protein
MARAMVLFLASVLVATAAAAPAQPMGAPMAPEAVVPRPAVVDMPVLGLPGFGGPATAGLLTPGRLVADDLRVSVQVARALEARGFARRVRVQHIQGPLAIPETDRVKGPYRFEKPPR